MSTVFVISQRAEFHSDTKRQPYCTRRAILSGASAAALLATLPAATAAGSGPAVQRSVRHYKLPRGLQLQAATGRAMPIKAALGDGRPVVLSFMYSSCTTICPITNQTLVEFGRLLGRELTSVNIVSISIDPDQDSVNKLVQYAAKTGNRGSFFTSDPGTSEAVQRIFDVWRGDKMNHQPVFLLAMHPDEPWVRLDGLITPQELMAEFRRLAAGG